MANSINDEEALPGQINNEDEHVLIDDINSNDFLVQSEEEMETTNVFDEFIRYSVLGKIFNNFEDAYNFYNEYGLFKGFGIRKHKVDRHKVTNEIYRRIFVCNKQGYKDMNDKRRLGDDVKRRSITRFGCKAMIQVTFSKKGEWVVDKFNDEHNHPLDPPSQVLKQRSHSIFHRSNECKDIVTLLSKAGLKSSEITKVVNTIRGNEDDKLTRIQCSNIVNSEKKTNLGKECHEIIIHFQEKAEQDHDFYFAMDLSTDGRLRNVFWADGRSRSSYCQFGDVVVFDTTYKTNKFGLSFAPFVGVNHYGQSTLFGAALLENETEVTFTWLFKQFLKCMHECPPVSIITDQDLAMGKAIAKVFAKTKHRFCAWHIKKHVLEHLQPFRSRHDDFEDTYIQWVKSKSVEDFESKWDELKEKYQIGDDTWLGNMYKVRHHWVKAYLKDTFFAGMTTSGRSESINSFFDGFVNSKTMLNEFVLQYDKAVSSRRKAEEDQDFRTLNSKPTLHSDHPIEAMAAESYTRNIYDVFKKEWKTSFDCGHEKLSKDFESVKYRVGYLEGNKEGWKVVDYRATSDSDFLVNCSCAKFETHGVLCKHILYIMKRKLVRFIPIHYILPRWTMKAKSGYIGISSRSNNSDATEQVSLLTLWSIRSKINKVLDNGQHSLDEIKITDTCLDSLLEKQNQKKNTRIELNTNNGSTIPIVTQHISQQISISDPVIPIKTKGCPRIATRIKSSMEVAMDLKKKRTCGYYKEKGHYATGCPKKKIENSKNKEMAEVEYH